MKLGTTLLCSIAFLLSCGCGSFKKSIAMEETLTRAVVDANGRDLPASKLLGTDYLLLYFSAHWCPPCQVFTPKLVEFYKANGGGKLFNAVLISSDHSETDMFNYMRETHMPWPAVQYGSDASKTLNKTFSGDGIPRLVLVNTKDEMLADSFKGRQYLGPQVVLEELKKILARRNTIPGEPSDADAKHLPTPRKLAKKFKINGFGQGSEQDIAIINGKFAAVGTELDEGVVVEQITSAYVAISFEGERYRLYP